MKLSELFAKVQVAGDVLSYYLYLATPDQDGVDVDLAAVGRVELRADAGEVRLYPESTQTDSDDVESEPILEMVLDQLPSESSGDHDLRLMVEMPLIRDETDSVRVSFSEVVDLLVAHDAQEAWLLMKPAAEFPDGVLPS